MHNWVMQVLWPDRGAAGEDTTGARCGAVERETACVGWVVEWNTFTLHGNSINIWGVFIWVVAMRDKCELSQ